MYQFFHWINQNFDCNDVGATVTVKLYASNGMGGLDSCATSVTVLDTVAPTVNCVPGVTVSLNAGNLASVATSDVNNGSSDNCGPVTLSVNPNPFDCSDAGPNTVTLSASDPSGNTGTCTSVVTVVDPVAPVAVCNSPIVVYLDQNGGASIATSDVDNGSSDNCGGVTLSLDVDTVDCSNVDIKNVVTLTVADVSGNSSSCTAVVVVEDTVSPTAVCVPTLIAPLNGKGQAIITPAMVDNGSFDNCTLDSLSIDQDTFTCSTAGPSIVTLTAYDTYGNTSTCTANVQILDNMAPTPVCVTSITVALDPQLGTVFVPVALVDGGSFDNCSGVTLVLSPQNFDCSDIGANPVTLTATDAAGNTNFCTSQIIVQDNVAPSALCQDITVNLDVTGTVTVVASDLDGGSSDHCDITFTVSPNTFDCSDVGPNTVALIVSDSDGNADACTATVTVLPPGGMPVATIATPDTAICEGDSVTLSANATGSGTAGSWSSTNGAIVFLPSATDPNATAGNFISPGLDTLIWTVSDGCAAVSDTVIVRVKARPIILALITQQISTFGGSDGEASIILVTGAIDSVKWSDGQTTGTATGLSAGSYTVFVVDTNGCISNVDTVTLDNPPASGVNVDIKVALEGPYDPATMEMNDDLRAFMGTGVIPITNPYGLADIVNPSVFTPTGSDAIVDWVHVELRDKNNTATVLFERAGLLQRDGDIVDLDGTSSLNFPTATPDDYYVVIKHRNHLAIISDTLQQLTTAPIVVDFFNGTVAAAGLNPMKNIGGKFVMYGGDADGNGVIENNDIFQEWLPNRGNSGYLDADMDMNGIVENVDLLQIWLPNRGISTNVP